MPSDSSSTDRLDAQIPGAFPDANGSQAAISTHQTLSQALFARRAEYTRPRNVRIKVGTWNVAAQKGTEQDVGAWFVGGKGIEESLAGLGVEDLDAERRESRESVSAQEARHTSNAPTVPHRDPGTAPGEEEVGIYALGLQEVVDINSPAEALRPYTDPTIANRWKAAIELALPKGYQLVSEQQLIGLLLLIYVSPTVHPHVKAVSTTSVGTGLMGYMGNKGAVTTRMVLGETTRLVFINSHLAAGADKAALERRNWDAGQITSRTRFDPITDAMGLTQGQGEGLGEEDFAFWFGDLNYRLEGMPGEDVRRLLTIHTKRLDLETTEDTTKDDASTSADSGYASKSSSDLTNNEDPDDVVPLPPDLDPTSLHTIVSSLLPHDELKQQQKAGKAFHDGWEEGPIRFLPSYKYDIGKVAVFDSSDKQRCPSWCDRVLYRTRAAKERYDARLKELEEARKKDEEMKAKGIDRAGDDDDVLFDYDPETDGDNNDTYDEYDENEDPEPEAVVTKEGFPDEILLECYTAHIRVLSSDHKPLEAVFSLKYDAVIPELKTAIHQEVARELDRQENEGRPSITLVVDRSTGTLSPENKDTTDSAFDGVDFGDVQFAKSKRRNITIANTGRVPATFGFTDRPVNRDQPEGPFPPWLSVTFDRKPDAPSKASSDDLHQQFTLDPADVCNAELKLKIEDLDTIRKLNEGIASMDEVLVLRVKDGRDHFLPIRAHWLQSALSRTVDKLIKIPEGGIRKLQHQKPDRGDGVKWSVPREIFRLTEAIEVLTERTLADWDMTGHEADKEKAPWQHNAAWPFIRQDNAAPDEDVAADVYDALDCDDPIDKAFPAGTPPKQRLGILADVLLLFLRSLQDGIITKSLWEKLEEGITMREKSKQQLLPDDEKMWALEILASAPNHLASFLLIVSMLQNVKNQIAEASKSDKTTPRSSIDLPLPASPKVSVRRKTLSKVPEVAIRQLINRNYAAVFVDTMFRAPNMEKLKDKDKAAKKERMAKIVELFLDDGDVKRR
ncbi:phosphatase family protein-like protein [Trematosphaeria pertusa]|uniref:Phosphatase family protein-like protein n=1 Tax=Trematosphaeria pertusa TaxID=390896 RepID=A0A6A6IWF1_9PLEO|nr:phosphatase family protein-like protein [Trematosphaeria pertusa]KAF2253940.1 phosphatase family protein-like protein [Trematosphaeria pertusa]